MGDIKNILKIAGVYTAMVLGAGFASGQELYSFFVRFGKVGYIGILVAGLLFFYVGYRTLLLCHRLRITDYDVFVKTVLGKKLGPLVQWSVALFLFVLFATMLAGGGAVIQEAFGVQKGTGVAVLAFLCFVTFLFDLDGLVNINAILAPIMVAGGIVIGLYTFYFEHVAVGAWPESFFQSPWLLSALTYGAYNLLTAVVVLSTMGGLVSKPRVAFWSALLGGIAMTALGLCLALPLFSSLYAYRFEIPLLPIVTTYPFALHTIYLVVLTMAIYTTALANGFAFIRILCRTWPLPEIVVKALVTLGAIALSQIGFSTFVGRVYPLFGLFGLLQMGAIMFRNPQKKL